MTEKPLMPKGWKLLPRERTDCLKGLCMLAIVTGHVSSSVTGDGLVVWQPWLDAVAFDSWGSLCSGMFLFLSGYGMFLSLKRNAPAGTGYLWQRIKKLFEPFLMMWVFYMLMLLLFDRQLITPHLLVDFFTMSFPLGIDAWFFKVITALYVVVWLLFRWPLSDGWRVAVMFIVTTAYFLMFLHLGFGPWWINSVLCFPLGMLYAWQRQQFSRSAVFPLMAIPVLVAGTLLTTISFFPTLLFSVVTTCLLGFVDLSRVPGLKFVGLTSFFFYFLEEPVYDYLSRPLSDHFLLYDVATLLIIALLTKGYKFISNSWSKKTQ